MQKNSEKISEASRQAAANSLKNILESVNPSQWEQVWEERLNATQRLGVCMVAGVSVDGGKYHEMWGSFTDTDQQKIRKAITKFVQIADQLSRACGVENPMRVVS